MSASSSLSERIEALDREARLCWRRVDELEDEEATLCHRLTGLEKIRRTERMEILSLEQLCKTAEMAMLQAEQEAADLDMKVQAFKRLDEEATTSGAAEQIDSTSIDGGSGPQVGAPKLRGPSALTSALKKVPAHEEKRMELMALLHEQETKIRREIADTSKKAAELRRSSKKSHKDTMQIEREISAMREELAVMNGEAEAERRQARAKQLAEGLRRRLQHDKDQLAAVRTSIVEGPSKQLGKEEQQSLELLQGISEVKARLRTQEGRTEIQPSDSNPSRTHRGGGNRQSTTSSSTPRLQMQSRGGGGGVTTGRRNGSTTWVSENQFY